MVEHGSGTVARYSSGQADGRLEGDRSNEGIGLSGRPAKFQGETSGFAQRLVRAIQEGPAASLSAVSLENQAAAKLSNDDLVEIVGEA